MIVRRREIVEVCFRLPPDGKLLNHPCIVLTNDEVNAEEEGFVAVMLTSNERYKSDLYSFEITNEMAMKPIKSKFCAARIHLIGNFLHEDVIVNQNSGNELRIDSFNRLLVQINRIAFHFKNELK